MNWPELSATSHTQTALAIRQELDAGRYAEAAAGIQELIDALTRSERRALKSQLVRLMTHVVKWRSQPERRSRSWIASIRSARSEIREIQDEAPSLTDDVVREMWDGCFALARDQAEAEMEAGSAVESLSWEECFDLAYRL